jgi:hypothetical protein
VEHDYSPSFIFLAHDGTEGFPLLWDKKHCTPLSRSHTNLLFRHFLYIYISLSLSLSSHLQRLFSSTWPCQFPSTDRPLNSSNNKAPTTTQNIQWKRSHKLGILFQSMTQIPGGDQSPAAEVHSETLEYPPVRSRLVSTKDTRSSSHSSLIRPGENECHVTVYTAGQPRAVL